jgi:tellurite resistance protein TerB
MPCYPASQLETARGRLDFQKSRGEGVDLMDSYLAEKLAGEVERYQNKDFLKAAMAALVLIAYADGSMGALERLRIDETLKTEPGLKEFNFEKATQILESYAKALREEGESTKRVFYEKVRRMAGDYKRARTVMRVCYLVVQADGRIDEGEMQEFRRLCGLLRLEPAEVWRKSWG